MKATRPKWLRTLRLFVVSALLLVLLVGFAFIASPDLLCVDTGEAQSDALVVLGGDAPHRAARAAELFHTSPKHPLVIVSGDGDCYESRAVLTNLGVPNDAITLECKSGTTWENAQLSIEILRRKSITNATIVTSWFHSRRALRTFQACAPSLHFSSRPTYYGVTRFPFRPTGIRAHVCEEYGKLLYYWFRWGVSPV